MALRIIRFLAVCIILLACTPSGCVEPEGSRMINHPALSDSSTEDNVAEFFAYHNDQGMLADMAIADIHFVPHSTRLSGTGLARLERYAELLATTGGTLHYDTALQDKQLIEARLDTAKRFLASAIPSNQAVQVVLGLPGGRGMRAEEAAAGDAVARQPEQRSTAYDLSDTEGVRSQ